MGISVNCGDCYSGVDSLLNTQRLSNPDAPVSNMSARFNQPSPAPYLDQTPDSVAGILVPKVNSDVLV